LHATHTNEENKKKKDTLTKQTAWKPGVAGI
jgi:hypothetical protein